VHKSIAVEPPRRRGAPGRAELRRLRAGVFRLGASFGLDTQGVVRFSEVISGQRWRQCGSADLEAVASDFVQLAKRATARRLCNDAGAAGAANLPRSTW